ncbi:MAG: ribonuclease HII [Armatimonadota bacterium]
MNLAEDGIAGVDEAGRGPVAGPVVAAAVLLPAGFDSTGIDDSKRLSEARRESAYARIVAEAVAWSIAEADVEEIDSINILQATHAAMRRAVNGLAIAPRAVRVDGNPVPNLHPRAVAVVGGDALHVEIAAASILAKVARDRLMRQFHREWPDYGFDVHKGYLTAAHRRAIETHGPCPIHRRSFAPINQFRLML